MEDEASILLDGKTLGNLRVVDLKQELEKRGLSKSGSKKDLVKRLKVQLEFEKLCGERKSAADCDLKLDLDADTEQNEFVQQYLAQQQKIYAEQKEAKRRIELEETLKSTEEKDICDSTKSDEDATVDDDDDQTEPDEPEEEDSRSAITSPKTGREARTGNFNPEAEISCLEVQDDVHQSTSEPAKIETENSEVQDDSELETSEPSKIETENSKIQDDSEQEASVPSKIETENSEVQDDSKQEASMPSPVKREIQNNSNRNIPKFSKVEVESSEIPGSTNQKISQSSKAEVVCSDTVSKETFLFAKSEEENSGDIIEKTSQSSKVEVTRSDGIDEEAFHSLKGKVASSDDVDGETFHLSKVEIASSDNVDKETSQPSKAEVANSNVQYDTNVLETSQALNTIPFSQEELATDIVKIRAEDSQNQITPSNHVLVDSSVEISNNLEVIDNVAHQITSSEITENANINTRTENHNTIDHRIEESSASETIQDKNVESSIENTQKVSHLQELSEEMHTDLREIVSPESIPLPEMEPATQFSTVPYSLMDIQLPESPGNVKSKSTSDSVENESVNNTEETHSNGIDPADIKSSKKKCEKKNSNEDPSEKLCSPDNDSNERSDELTQRSKESNFDDSKLLGSRSQTRKGENDHKSSKSKAHVSDRKTRRSKVDIPIHRDSRSKSKERKRSRRSSGDSPPRRHSRSKSRERSRKLKEDSHSYRDSRSRSKDKDRRTRKYEKDSSTRKVSRNRRDSRSLSKENERKTRKSSIESKRRRTTHSRRKSQSVSNDSKSDHSSDSEEEIRKKKGKYKESKLRRRAKKESDSENDKSSSSSSGRSPSQSSKRKRHSARQKNRHRNRDSSEGTQSSRSRSPAKKKLIDRADVEPVVTSKYGRQKSKESDQNSRSRDSSPNQNKSKNKPAEKSGKQKEASHEDEVLDDDKVPKSPSHDDDSTGKKLKKDINESLTFSKDANEKLREHMDKSVEDEGSENRSQESSPVNITSKNKPLEQDVDSINLIKTSRAKRSESSDGSRSRSRERSPPQSKLKHKSESHIDTKKTHMPAEESKSPKSRSISREQSPERKPNELPSDSIISSKISGQEKDPESGSSDDNQISRSKSQESSPVHIARESTDESSVDSAALIKCPGQESQSSVEGRDSRSRSREKSPDLKRSKICSNETNMDSSDTTKYEAEPAKTIVSESDIPGAIKIGNIIIVKKEPLKQKLRIKRDNVVIASKYKKTDIESKSEKSEISESSEENQREPSCNPTCTQYVSRKITLSSRSQSVASDDEPKSKRSKWGNLASSQKTPTINISTDSLKNWFPDFKLLKDPTPEEPVSLSKEESDMEITVNKPEEDTTKQISNMKRFQEPQQEEQMEVDQVETGPVSKILFIQNLVRPFTLNQLKELLRETGNFIEEDFWIDKIKSKCFVTYETEEEAIKTRNHLNGTRWPSSNPKILSVEFSNKKELAIHRNGNDIPKPVLQPLPEPNEESRASYSADEFRKKDQDQDRRRDRVKQQPVREWDKDKITQESPDRERSGKDGDKSKHLDKKEKKDVKRRANDDTPAKLLDDLFQKTKASPCIYWLPLTDEQVQERTEGRRLRQLEREKRIQLREQEDTENKSKGPRSRNRTREAETRRSSTRSRSPVTRRR